MALKGSSSAKIAEALTDRGIANSRGGAFNAAGVRWILHNEFYTGKVRYEDKVVAGDHEPVISPVLLG